MNRIRLWGVLVACALSVAARATFRHAGLPTEKVATIRITDLNAGGFYNVRLVEIDGVAELPWVPVVRVVPGLHHVTFRYYSSLTRFEGQPITLLLDARGARVYRIDGQAIEDRARWFGWIVDERTGEVVAGQKPVAYHGGR